MSKTVEKPYSRGGSTICVKHDHLLASCPPTVHAVIQAAKLDGLNMEGALQRSQEECNNLEQALADAVGALKVAGRLVELWASTRLMVSKNLRAHAAVRVRALKDHAEAVELLEKIHQF